jgi:hypothetical protein
MSTNTIFGLLAAAFALFLLAVALLFPASARGGGPAAYQPHCRAAGDLR